MKRRVDMSLRTDTIVFSFFILLFFLLMKNPGSLSFSSHDFLSHINGLQYSFFERPLMRGNQEKLENERKTRSSTSFLSLNWSGIRLFSFIIARPRERRCRSCFLFFSSSLRPPQFSLSFVCLQANKEKLC